MDFFASMLFALQGANWQRAGGNGEHPEVVSRPLEDDDDSGPGFTIEQLEQRKKAFYDQMERRRGMGGG